ncbi:ferritin-like domain-containing protein [Pyxidicoccus xibeiensis]|uniref:ferritin-like domain-containing protein n=1 Tax=Pyxidicoccus xibeiensis TaxID=2906759 RepID=UPI0020A7827D|nr:ferritin-like domain-containing protein [Pyxidicoccus xibeiensis]MCP3142959.1 ferritin-like domain-containing protein [Pyxidicoccus xibeiensis]
MAMSRRKLRRTLSRLLLLAPVAAAGPGCGWSSTSGCEEKGGISHSNIPISVLRLSDGGTPPEGASCEELCALAGGLPGPCELKPEVGWVMCPVPNLCEGRRPEGLCTDGAVAGRVPPLGVLFAKMAHLEAASVPAFERLADELAAHGAPERLVRAARRSAAEEVRHARAMESLAVRHGAAMPEMTVAPFRDRSLEALALENAVEGCVRETFGALLAAWQARCAEDAGVRESLATIAPDELRHAELSYAIDAWAMSRLSPEARARVEAARREAWLALERDSAASTLPEEVARQAGLPSSEVAQRLVRELARSMAARTPALA